MTSIVIEDPAGRLPAGVREILPSNASGRLFVPDRGAPVHPDTVSALAKRMDAGRRLCSVPEVPMSSQLGLPAWKPLLYWEPGGIWSRIRHRMGRGGEPIGDFEPIVGTTLDERVHYFARHYPALSPKPSQVSVVVANVCNLSCVMCPYHSPELTPTHKTDYFESRQFMAWETMERIAHDCGALGLPVKMGNIEEPLLHPRILDFVRLCRERGVPSVHITSNALPLTERRIRELFESGLTSIYCSMDASRPETYARVRGDRLERVERNVRSLLRIREELGVDCRVFTSFVKNKGVSMEEVDEFREKWVAEADGVILYNLAEYETGTSHFEELNAVVKEAMERARGRWACLSPFQEMYILPDERIYYCCETIGMLAFEEPESMGRYPTQGLLEIWQGPVFEGLRRDLLTNELEHRKACKDCGIWMAHVSATEQGEGRRTTRNMITEIVERT